VAGVSPPWQAIFARTHKQHRWRRRCENPPACRHRKGNSGVVKALPRPGPSEGPTKAPEVHHRPPPPLTCARPTPAAGAAARRAAPWRCAPSCAAPRGAGSVCTRCTGCRTPTASTTHGPRRGWRQSPGGACCRRASTSPARARAHAAHTPIRAHSHSKRDPGALTRDDNGPCAHGRGWAGLPLHARGRPLARSTRTRGCA
jgi:hypothetical protein